MFSLNRHLFLSRRDAPDDCQHARAKSRKAFHGNNHPFVTFLQMNSQMAKRQAHSRGERACYQGCLCDYGAVRQAD